MCVNISISQKKGTNKHGFVTFNFYFQCILFSIIYICDDVNVVLETYLRLLTDRF